MHGPVTVLADLPWATLPGVQTQNVYIMAVKPCLHFCPLSVFNSALLLRFRNLAVPKTTFFQFGAGRE